MLRGTLMIAGLVALSAWGDDFESRRIQSSLVRNAQDRQFALQQTQIVQGLLRVEESRMLNRQSYVQLLPTPGFELVRRDENARSTQAQQYHEELDRLSARDRHLEEQRRRLMQTLSTSVYRQSQGGEWP